MTSSGAKRPLAWLVASVLSGLSILSACVSEPSDDALIDRWRGENAVAQGRFDWARQHFHADIERHPEYLPSLRQEGLSWLSGYQQSLSTGVDLLSRYLQQHGEDEEIEQRLVSVLLMLGEREALETWVETLDDSPQGQRLRAEVYLRDDSARAVLAIERALAAAPDEANVHHTATLLFEHLEEGDRVVVHARRALELDPFDFRAAYLLGRWTQRLGDRQQGRHWLELHQQLRRLQADGTMAPLQPSVALQLMEELEPRLPAVPFSWQQRRLQLLFEAGELAAAESLLDVLVTSPQVSEGDLLEMATWAGDGGRRRVAGRLFERILQDNPEHVGALASLALLEIEQGNTEGARRFLMRGLEIRPQFARAHFLLGQVAVLEDQGEDARRHFEQALWLAPWEWPWRVALCDLLLAMGDRETFLQTLEKAPEETPGWLAYRQSHS